MKPFVYSLLQLIILFAAVLTILDGGTIGVSASTTTVLHFQGNSEDIGPNGNEIAMDSRGRIIGVYSDGCNFDHPCINITDKSASKNPKPRFRPFDDYQAAQRNAVVRGEYSGHSIRAVRQLRRCRRFPSNRRRTVIKSFGQRPMTLVRH